MQIYKDGLDLKSVLYSEGFEEEKEYQSYMGRLRRAIGKRFKISELKI